MIEKNHDGIEMTSGSIRILLDCNNLRDAKLQSHVDDVVRKCSIFLRTGDQEASNKISYSKLHAQFKDRVYLVLFH